MKLFLKAKKACKFAKAVTILHVYNINGIQVYQENEKKLFSSQLDLVARVCLPTLVDY